MCMVMEFYILYLMAMQVWKLWFYILGESGDFVLWVVGLKYWGLGCRLSY